MKKSKQLENITFLYLFFMIGIFPLFFRDNYIDIVSAKKKFFQTVSILFFLCVAWIAIPRYCIQRKEIDNEWKGAISCTDICVIIFALVNVVSCIITPEGKEAFWGNKGRGVGGFFLLICVGIYFCISRFFKEGNILLWVFLLANCGVWLIVVCNFWKLDILGMHRNLIESQYTFFIGTMGNININSGYSGVITALMMGLYYLGQERLTKVCFWSASILGIYACYCTRSDSWMLAVGSGILLLLRISIKEEKIRKWISINFAFFFGLVLMKMTDEFDMLIGWNNEYILDLRSQHTLYTLIEPKVLLVCGTILFLLFFASGNHSIIKDSFEKLLREYGQGILLGGTAIGIISVILVIFPLDDSFGNGRGYIWKRTIRNFLEYPFLYKIFGYGPNCFLQSMEKNYGTEMRTLYGTPFIDAHNEYLQFLAVTGMLGAISYMGIQVSVYISCFNRRDKNPVLLLGCIGILSYMMQGLINNPQVFTTPLYFVFLGVIENLCRENLKL